MELDKEQLPLFYYHKKKSAANAHRISCETYDENVIAIRMCPN